MTPIEALKKGAAKAGGQEALSNSMRDLGVKKISQATISRKMNGNQSIPLDWFLALQILYGIPLHKITSPNLKNRGSRDTQ